jgi:MFS transporter, DHA2 family, glioxin efflux transporter
MSTLLEEKSVVSTTPGLTPKGSIIGQRITEAVPSDGQKSETQSVRGEVDDGIEYPSGFRLAFIVVALGLSVFLVSLHKSLFAVSSGTDSMLQVSLDMTIVATAIPKITDEFHGLDFVSWIGSAFFLTLAAFQSSKSPHFSGDPLPLRN